MLDKAAPVYTGRDQFMRQLAEYEHYLREQTEHELKLLQRKIADMEAAMASIAEAPAAAMASIAEAPAAAMETAEEIPAYAGDEEVTEDNGV